MLKNSPIYLFYLKTLKPSRMKQGLIHWLFYLSSLLTVFSIICLPLSSALSPATEVVEFVDAESQSSQLAIITQNQENKVQPLSFTGFSVGHHYTWLANWLVVIISLILLLQGVTYSQNLKKLILQFFYLPRLSSIKHS